LWIIIGHHVIPKVDRRHSGTGIMP
jgi:hypothetical protein